MSMSHRPQYAGGRGVAGTDDTVAAVADADDAIVGPHTPHAGALVLRIGRERRFRRPARTPVKKVSIASAGSASVVP